MTIQDTPQENTRERYNVLGIGVSVVDLDSAARMVIDAAMRGDGGFVCVTGVHGVIESRDNPQLRSIHNRSFLTVPDGMPLVWIGKLNGRKTVSRVYGPDLMAEICARTSADQRQPSHFLCGSTPRLLSMLVRALETRFPGINIVGTFSPPMWSDLRTPPLAPDEEQALRDQTESLRPDFLWLGLSTPKQELFMDRYASAGSAPLPCGMMLGVGAAFDILAGAKSDAPGWMKRSGLQWLFRLLQEPRRLCRRYLTMIPRFLTLVCLQALRIKRFPIARAAEGVGRGGCGKRTAREIAAATAIFLAGAMLIALFHYRGQRLDPGRFGNSVFVWAAKRWSLPGSVFSHGWIIPLASLFLVWRKRAAVLAAKKRTSLAGFGLVVTLLLLHMLGYRSILPRLSLLAFIGLLWAVPYSLWGRGVARHLFFPAVYLVFCVPFTFLVHLTFPLRILASTISVHLLNALGVPCARVGTALHVQAAGGMAFDVADPCSGLKYIVAISALTALYAYISQSAQWKRWLIFALSVPLAVIANVARVVGIVFAGLVFGKELAAGLYHDFSGYLVFAVAVALIMLVSAALNRLEKGGRAS